MIRAQLTLTDGKTPGQWRKGAAVILACIARGCRIVPNDRNDIPDEWSAYIVSEVSDGTHRADRKDEQVREIVPEINVQVPRKRGRPKKVKV